MVSSPVEAQNTSFGILHNQGLVLNTEISEGGTSTEPGPVELAVDPIELVLEVASWARNFGRLRIRRTGLLAILLLSTMTLISSSCTLADSSLVT